VSWRISRLRDNPACADAEYEALSDAADPGISPILTFDPRKTSPRRSLARGARPRVAILREQGVNSHLETAYAFDRAGFDAHDVHMSDLLAGRATWRISPVRWRAAASRTAIRWVPVKAGRRRSASTRNWPICSPRSSAAKTRSRWVSATAAR
jgi:Phosphoribosylformylglycinamidine (FGAM) synthase, glutamine amidotransferase domain